MWYFDHPDYDRTISGATDGAPDSVEYTLERQDEVDGTSEQGDRGLTTGLLTDIVGFAAGGFVIAVGLYSFMVPA